MVETIFILSQTKIFILTQPTGVVALSAAASHAACMVVASGVGEDGVQQLISHWWQGCVFHTSGPNREEPLAWATRSNATWHPPTSLPWPLGITIIKANIHPSNYSYKRPLKLPRLLGAMKPAKKSKKTLYTKKFFICTTLQENNHILVQISPCSMMP